MMTPAGRGPVGVPRAEGRQLLVLRAGPLTTVQDAGRPGWAHLGVPRSGFLDRASATWANRLVGNPEATALLETTGGALAVRVTARTRLAVTGAPVELRVDGRLHGMHEAWQVPAGAVVALGPALAGVRSYLALDGGVGVEPVLGSRSRDLLSGTGPAPLHDGAVLPLGEAVSDLSVPRTHGLMPRDVFGARARGDLHLLRVLPGPRVDWLDDVAVLDGAEFRAGAASNRVGLRLERSGTAWARRPGEVASEPMVAGAVQLPPSGDPVIFLADHPTTGGYPVVAVVVDEDLDRCAQVRPGEGVRLRLVRG